MRIVSRMVLASGWVLALRREGCEWHTGSQRCSAHAWRRGQKGSPSIPARPHPL